MYDDDRAVSITVGYVLNFAIATVLFSALLIGGSGLIESQTRSVTQDELSVTGQQLASEISSADRLVRAEVGTESAPEDLRLRTELPDRTAAGSYTIIIEHTGTEGTIELRSTNPEVVVEIDFRSETSVQDVRVNGGSTAIEYETDELAVAST